MPHVTARATALTCAAVVLGLGLLAGCADPTGSNALTAKNYTSADGVMGESGLITARNVLLVSAGTGATVSGAFGNNGNATDSVVSISVAGMKATMQGSALDILPGSALTFGAPATADGPQAFLTGTFTPGNTIGLRVTFAHASQLVLDVPILPRDGYYTAVPTPSATPTVASSPASTPAASTPATSTPATSTPATSTPAASASASAR